MQKLAVNTQERALLARALPAWGRVSLPVTRDQMMLLMAATNQVLLGLETYLAHSISGTIVPNERIPVIFGPIAGVLLLIAGLIALRARAAANLLASIVFAASIGVGLLGTYYHLVRAALPDAPFGEQISTSLLIWAPPVLGPLMFALVGVLGISAAWVEDPPESGRLTLLGNLTIQMPYSKTRAYLFMISLGALLTLISSVLDHARTEFATIGVWLPVAVGVIGTITPLALAWLEKPNRVDILSYCAAMALMVAVGVLGVYFHSQFDLTTRGQIVTERLIRGAPILAPMLFANIGALGLLVVLDPAETL